MVGLKRSFVLIITLFVALTMVDGIVMASFNDIERSSNNHATAYIPSRWLQTSEYDFTDNATEYNVATQQHPGQVELLSPSPTLRSALFALRGGLTSDFYKFNITSNSWSAVASTPANVDAGGYLTYDGSAYIYAFRGGSTTDFWRYNVITNTWGTLASTPGTVAGGASLCYYNGLVYALRGGSTGEIWRYNPLANTWTVLTSTFPIMSAGSSLTIANDLIYIIRPSGGGITNVFLRTDLAATSWVALSQTNFNNAIGDGAAILHGQGNHLMATRGGGHPEFYEYDIDTGTWFKLKNFPWNIRSGGDLAFDGLKYWGISGDGKTNFASYARSTNTWTKRVATPGTIKAGGNLVYVAYSTSYALNGYLNSSVFDTGVNEAKFDSLFWDGFVPSGTNIAFQARASNTRVWVPDPEDPTNGTWDLSGAWTNLGSSSPLSMTSLSGRYVQWRVVLTTTDPAKTPILYEVRIYYKGF